MRTDEEEEMTPSFQEAHISQVPAIRLLQQPGHAYLSPEEAYAERRTKRRHDLLGEGVPRTDTDWQ